jgi:hypothetical protein
MLNNAQYTLFCTSPPLVINAAFKVDFTEDVEKEKGGTVILFFYINPFKHFFFFKYFFGGFFSFCSYIIQHCFICRPSDSTVPTDAGIEPRTVATCALAVRRSNH